MKYRRGKKTGRKITIAVVALTTVLACGLLIALDVRKVAAEKKLEPKPLREHATIKVGPSLPPLPPPDQD
jgi:hypothetical protein